MFALLKNKNFSLLWFAGLISITGNWMLLAALPFHVYEITGSALATSLLFMAFVAPGIVFGSVAGVFVDRWDRKRILVVFSLLQALTVLLLLFAQDAEWIWVAYVALFIEASLARFFSPAENALLPNLVGEEHLMAANSLNALNDNLGRLIGPAIGGALLGIFGFQSVILVDAGTYLAAALLIIFLQVAAASPVKDAKASVEKAVTASQWGQVWQELVAGLSYIRRSRILKQAFIIVGIALFADAIVSAILVVFLQADAGLDAVQYGWLMTARGLGGIIGGLTIAQFARRFQSRTLIAGGLAATSLLILVSLLFPTLPVLLVCLVLLGVSVIAWVISLQTIFQKETQDSFRGRVFGAFGTTNTLVMLIGSGISGFLADQVGAFILMAAAGLIYLVAAGTARQLLQPVKKAEAIEAGAAA